MDNGVLTVRGCLPTFYLKQVAFAELMRSLCGCEINDLIKVTLPVEAQRVKCYASIDAARRRPAK